MNKKIKKKELVVIISVVLILILSVVAYEKTHPKFDEKISGKEAIVVSEVAKIHYDDPLGRNVGTVTESQKIKLTGKMTYVMQSDIIMMEIHLEDNNFAWILKKDIVIPE